MSSVLPRPHFGPLDLPAGDSAGAGLTAGLAVGALSVGVTGDDTGAGVEVTTGGVAGAGVVFVAGSLAHPTVKRTEESVSVRIAERLITVMFVIDFCLVLQD